MPPYRKGTRTRKITYWLLKSGGKPTGCRDIRRAKGCTGHWRLTDSIAVGIRQRPVIEASSRQSTAQLQFSQPSSRFTQEIPSITKPYDKHHARAEDRHNPTMPNTAAGLWARGLTTTRVADLFRTLPGLPGHWIQLQAGVKAGNNHFFTTSHFGGGFNDGGKTAGEGKQFITWIANAVIKAAEAARFDFPLQQLSFTRDMAWLKIMRVNDRVIVISRPLSHIPRGTEHLNHAGVISKLL